MWKYLEGKDIKPNGLGFVSCAHAALRKTQGVIKGYDGLFTRIERQAAGSGITY
jgi:hypothetical protein